MSDTEKDQAALLEDVFGKDSDEEGQQKNDGSEGGKEGPAQGPSAADLEDDDQEPRDAGACAPPGYAIRAGRTWLSVQESFPGHFPLPTSCLVDSPARSISLPRLRIAHNK